MMNYKYNFFLRLMGGFFIFFTLYMRFIRSRAIGPIDFTYTEMKFYLYIYLISIFSVTLIIMILIPIYLKHMGKIFIKIKKHEDVNFNTPFFKIRNFLIKTFIKVHKNYDKMIEAFYKPIYVKCQNTFPKFWPICSNFICTHVLYNMIPFFIVFSYLPPCLVAFTFFFETVIKNEYYYFPLVIFLMILPIGTRILFYSVKLYTEHFQQYLSNIIKVQEIPTPDGLTFGYTWADNVSLPELEEDDYTLELLNNFVQRLRKNNGEIIIITSLRESLNTAYFRKYFVILSMTFWISSFSYLLYNIIINKNI